MLIPVHPIIQVVGPGEAALPDGEHLVDRRQIDLQGGVVQVAPALVVSDPVGNGIAAPVVGRRRLETGRSKKKPVPRMRRTGLWEIFRAFV